MCGILFRVALFLQPYNISCLERKLLICIALLYTLYFPFQNREMYVSVPILQIPRHLINVNTLNQEKIFHSNFSPYANLHVTFSYAKQVPMTKKTMVR